MSHGAVKKREQQKLHKCREKAFKYRIHVHTVTANHEHVLMDISMDSQPPPTLTPRPA